MTKPPQPHWQPIEKLPLIASMIDEGLALANEQYASLKQAKEKPYMLDDDTVKRAIKVLTDQKNDLSTFDEQLRRWQAEPLTTKERREIERLQLQMQKLRMVNTELLALADELKAYTIDKLLAKSDYEVGLEYVSGKLYQSTNSHTKTGNQTVNRDTTTFYFFLFPMKLALYDEPDGNMLSSLRFQVTFPILPRQYRSFEVSIGSLATQQKLYGMTLEMMVMQTIQCDYPEALDWLLARHPEYPDAEVRVLVDGKITVSGEACWIREEMQVGEMFRLML